MQLRTFFNEILKKMEIELNRNKYNKLGFFRFKKLNQKYLLTNDSGNYLFLKKEEFKAFLEDKLNKSGEPYLSLVKKNFVKDELDIDKAIARYRSKTNFLFEGPSLHIVIPTLRCNQQCIYCHASAQSINQTDKDMDNETASKILDVIFNSTSSFIAIEFQGGEPLVNWPLIKFFIAEAQKKNKKFKKQLEIRLVSNFSLMTEERYNYLLKNNVSFCVSLDGPKQLHIKNRPMRGGNSYVNVAKWIRVFNRDYPALLKKGYIWKMSARATISRFSLNYYKAIIDECVKLGLVDIFLYPLDPFGFSAKNWQTIGYTAEEFIDFYKKSLDYIIRLNFKGKNFLERMAKLFLIKILTDEDPNMMELRSPCGAGIGQLAYNYNGDIYTCDEGRMMSMMGDESFRLGNVRENSYQEIVSNPIARTLCEASCLDGLPQCSECAYKSYCGVCPIYNYFMQGNIFGQMPNNDRCKINKGILDCLFTRMENKKIKKVFEKWIEK